jgi:hypothetical protein
MAAANRRSTSGKIPAGDRLIYTYLFLGQIKRKMKNFESSTKPMMWFMALLLAAVVAGCGGGGDGIAPTAPGAGSGVGGAGRGPAPVVMGTAANFVILAQSTITNVPTSVIAGNVGLSPATGAGIGLTCAEVTGVITVLMRLALCHAV